MKIIPFPGSGLTKRGNSSENYRMDANRPLYLVKKKSGSDILDISAEAKMKFQQEKIVKLNRARLVKEAQKYFAILDMEFHFADSDPRNIIRGERVAEGKLKLSSNFYKNEESSILRIIAEKNILQTRDQEKQSHPG